MKSTKIFSISIDTFNFSERNSLQKAHKTDLAHTLFGFEALLCRPIQAHTRSALAAPMWWRRIEQRAVISLKFLAYLMGRACLFIGHIHNAQASRFNHRRLHHAIRRWPFTAFHRSTFSLARPLSRVPYTSAERP